MDGFLPLTPLVPGAQPAGTLGALAAEPRETLEPEAQALFTLLLHAGMLPPGQPAGDSARSATAQTSADALLAGDKDLSAGEGSEALPLLSGLSLLPQPTQAAAQTVPPTGGASAAPPGNAPAAGMTASTRTVLAPVVTSSALPAPIQSATTAATDLMDGAALATLADGDLPTKGSLVGGLTASTSGKPLPAEGRDLPAWLQQAAFSAFLDGQMAQDDGIGRASSIEQAIGSSALHKEAEAPLPAQQASALPAAGVPGGAGLAQSPAEARAFTAPPPALPLYSPAGTPAWDQEMAGQIRWLARQELSRAELLLHPAELGALEVRISTEEDRTSVSFVAQTPAARELLEHSLPRLRELLAGSGLQLTQGDVSERGPDERRAQQAADANTWPAGRGSAEEEAPAMRPLQAASLRLVDHYV